MGKKIAAAAMAIAFLIAGCSAGNGKLSYEEAVRAAESLAERVKVEQAGQTAFSAELDDEESESAAPMPSIGSYPLSVLGLGRIDVEILSSTEKGIDNLGRITTDSWLYQMARQFNMQKYKVNDKTVSISLRPMPSGIGADYICSQTYTPDAYTPSCMLWKDVLASSGINAVVEEERLVGNTSGLIIKSSVYYSLFEKHGAIRLSDIIDAVIGKEITFGYTNPFTSSTGLSNLVTILSELDPDDPTSQKAASKLAEFQSMVESSAMTTSELVNSAIAGELDCLSVSYQSYVHYSAFEDYIYMPFGSRQDSPMFTFGSLSDEKHEALRLFIDYCKSPESQAAAKEEYGFNYYDEYIGEPSNVSGEDVSKALSMWKEVKDTARPLVAVFIVDESSNMQGISGIELIRAMKNAGKYISSSTYFGMASFSTNVKIHLPIAKYDRVQKAKFAAAADSISAYGSTSVYNAIAVGLKMLLDAKAELPESRIMMIVLSEGTINKGSKHYSLKDIEPIVSALGVPVHVIGYNAHSNELKELAAINNATYIDAHLGDIIYQLQSVFNAKL
ncbi:MAG: VWA domain-containing protein [Eubacteriaceae bacterium]|nr:VWA domain-containing protein [Eubacteriaceae bacterium]